MDEFYLQTISMNVELSNRFAPDVDVLDLLGGDVLALRQLEDVLLPVNNLQRAILQQIKKLNENRKTRRKSPNNLIKSDDPRFLNAPVAICRYLQCGASRLRPESLPFFPGL